MLTGKGSFFLIGGGPAARTLGDPLINRFVEAAGGSQANLTIITAGSEEPESVNACYWEIFATLGVTNLFSPKIVCPADAEVSDIAQRVAQSSAVFIAGGAQGKLAERLAGTAIAAAIEQVYHQGGILGGTSAGASIFGNIMILDGGTGDKHLRHNMIDVGIGFGLLGPAIAIDTHCSSRGRVPRIISLLINHPELLAIGIDEDTVLFVGSDGIAEVAGYNAVYIFDSSASNIADNRAICLDSTPRLSISGITLHCLTRGDRFDLALRQPVLTTAAPVVKQF
ncbi:MAG: cyanophycinase [Acidobacteriota bacterium]